MSSVSVNAEATIKALERYAIDLESAAGEAMGVALRAAKALGMSQVGRVTTRRTGRLQDEWQPVQISNTRGRLFILAPYAAWVNDGTRPHRIAARNAKFLRFTVGGVVMFRRSVMHPGTRPRLFVQSAAAAGQEVLRAASQERVESLARAFSR